MPRELEENEIPTRINQISRQGDNIVLPDPIGLQPTDERSLARGQSGVSGPNMLNVTQDSMPILEIIPAYPKITGGLELYRLKPGMDNSDDSQTNLSYRQELLEFYNITLRNELPYLRVAYMNVSPPIESFTNDYEESMFSNLADAASKGIRELKFATGTTTAGVAVDKLQSFLKNAGGLGQEATQNLDAFNKRVQEAQAAQQLGSINQQSIVDISANVALGNKLDFPQIWKSSGWSPSYSVNVRLYNPFPGEKKATEKYITGPLTALMMFVVPRTRDGHTFFWPWLCKYRVRGLFNVKAGYIKSIQVIKGGDDNNIAFNQRPGIVDVKIELGTLYQTMISSTNSNASDIPTLTNWLEEFSEAKRWADGSQVNQAPRWTRFGTNADSPLLGSNSEESQGPLPQFANINGIPNIQQESKIYEASKEETILTRDELENLNRITTNKSNAASALEAATPTPAT